MTQAAAQCHEYLTAKYPGILISRFACRDTAGGSVSQHSAYGRTASDPTAYHSNGMDIFGPNKSATPLDQEYIQEVVNDLWRNRERWSIRLLLWRDGDAHENHAHVDFWPRCLEHQWCNRPITPRWRLSGGSVIATRDPVPENGAFNGEEGMPQEQWFQLIDALFDGRPDVFRGDPDYWKHQVPPGSDEWEDFWSAFVRAISPT